MTDYRKAYQNAKVKRRENAKRMPEGLRLRKRRSSSLDTPTYRFVKHFMMVLIAIACAVAVILFVRSFLSGESAPQKPVYYKEQGYQKVNVDIRFKPDSPQQ